MNIQNIKNLLRTYFVENWKRDLWLFGVLTALAICADILGNGSNDVQTFVAVLFILFYSARSFVELSNRASCMHTLLVPGTATEKVSVKIFLSCLYFVAGCIVSILLGNVIGYGVRYLYYDSETTAFAFLFNNHFNAMPNIVTLYLFMSILFFSSIYFKGKNIAKTLLVIFGFCIFFTLLIWGVAWLNYSLLVPDGMRVKELVWSDGVTLSWLDPAWLFYLLSIGGTLYFYGLSFLRFKETEA